MGDICNTIEKSFQGENPFFVKELETGIVVLGWNQHFYGYTIFMCKKHATKFYQLEDELLLLMLMICTIIGRAILNAVNI